MTVSQYSKETEDGEQLTVYFSADYEGVSQSDVTSITASFYDSSNNQLLTSYDVTGESKIEIPISKDFSLKSVISFNTASSEYESVANYAIKRFSYYKISQLIEQNDILVTSRATRVLSLAPALIENAVYVHAQGKRVKYDRLISDVNKLLDSVLHC